MQPSSVFSRVRLLCLAPALVLFVTACGGGGGGKDEGGGGQVAASLTVSPTQVTVTASANTSSTPTTLIDVTVNNGPASGAYLLARATDNAIVDMTFSDSGGYATITVLFEDPSSLAPGSYSDTVEISICTDSTCNTTQSGSTVAVRVTYIVTLDASVTLSANPTTTGAGQATTLSWSSTHAQSCTASGEWSGDLPTSGSQTVTVATAGSHVYEISCSDPGAPAQASVTVTAVGPSLSFTAFPATVALDKPVTLRWQGQYASGCEASGDWSGSLPASGFHTFVPSSLGTENFHLVCSNAAASDEKDVSVTVGAAPSLPPATAYRVNEAHDGVVVTSNGAQFPPLSAPTWTRDLGAPVSYPLIADGMVFIATANPDGSYGNQLYALDASTGATIWGPVAIAGTYFGSGLTYENGRVFLLMFDGGLHAFNASNGGVLWTTQLTGYWYDASPNAYGGSVFIAGNDGLSAVEEASGEILWTAGEGATTDWASPSVSSEGVYMQEGYSCAAGAYDPVSGSNLWRSTSQCNTPWGYASVIKNGNFFGRVGASLNLFEASTGSFMNQLASERAPAVTDDALIALNAGILSSTRLSDLVQNWTFTGDGTLMSAPIVVNNTVFVGASSGNVYGVDTDTGAQVWVGTSPVPIGPDSENGGPMPPSGAAAGENLLIFVSDHSVVAWQLQ